MPLKCQQSLGSADQNLVHLFVKQTSRITLLVSDYYFSKKADNLLIQKYLLIFSICSFCCHSLRLLSMAC